MPGRYSGGVSSSGGSRKSSSGGSNSGGGFDPNFGDDGDEASNGVLPRGPIYPQNAAMGMLYPVIQAIAGDEK